LLLLLLPRWFGTDASCKVSWDLVEREREREREKKRERERGI
jgi:hypothetical protein